MEWFRGLYWRFGIWKVHQRIKHAVGAVQCWWLGGHFPVWVAGSLTPLAYASDDSGRPPPAIEQWNGTYCARCGKTLAGKTKWGDP